MCYCSFTINVTLFYYWLFAVTWVFKILAFSLNEILYAKVCERSMLSQPLDFPAFTLSQRKWSNFQGHHSLLYSMIYHWGKSVKLNIGISAEVAKRHTD